MGKLTNTQRDALRESAKVVDTSDRCPGPCLTVRVGGRVIDNNCRSDEAAEKAIEDHIDSIDKGLDDED